MHVVHVYDGHEKVYRGRGSVPGVVWNVARETAALGHQVTVIERQWEGLAKQDTHEGVSFHRLNLKTGSDSPWDRVPYETVQSPTGVVRLIGDRINFAIQALRRLRTLEYDIIHVHLPFAANVMLTVAPWLRDDTVYTAHIGELRLNALEEDDSSSHESDTTDGGVDVPAVVRRFSPDVILARRVARSTVLNDSIRSIFIEQGVDADSLYIVPNGVDFERFASSTAEAVEAVDEKYKLSDAVSVLFVGTVMPRKGVLEMVRAVSAAHESFPDIRLVIAGNLNVDPEYVEKVRTLIRDHEISSVVEMVGFVSEEELPALYAAADLFVMPSLEEGFGMTVVEAMAAATPVIGTCVGGIPDVVEEGTHGFVVPPGDSAALETKLRHLLSDAEERERLGANAQQRARDYHWERIAARFEDIYEEVVG